MSWPVIAMAIGSESDVVAVRQRARRIAELLGFNRRDQTRIATAVSEIARNAFVYAGSGRVEFLIEPKDTPQLFQMRISDKGKGIQDLQAILDGKYRSQSGMGLGLIGARRLMDQFKINSKPGEGTTVDLGQRLTAKRGRITQSQLLEIVNALKREGITDPLTALREQNRELTISLIWRRLRLARPR